MITFITALFPEARTIITKLHLKQNPSEPLYQLFEGEHHRLIITGAGMISAAMAVSRHFANYPIQNTSDLVVNFGVAGYTQGQQNTSDSAHIGDLFLASHLIERSTGRTFYPDLLYRHTFRLLPVTTTPVVCTDTSSFYEETLIDMEASALYQALLPHISPDRMLFFKVVSDFPGKTSSTAIQPMELLVPHIDSILSYVEQLQHFLEHISARTPVLTEKETTLVEHIKYRLPMTETMQNEFQRMLSYAKLSGSSLANSLESFLATLPELPIRGKKQAMPHLQHLRELILNEAINTTGSYSTSVDTSEVSFFQPFFATVYAEKEAWNEEWLTRFSATPIFINHYKDIFNRSH